MSKAQEIIKLKELLDKNLITKEEFEGQKTTILNRTTEINTPKTRLIACILILFVMLIFIIASCSSDEETGTNISDKNEVTELIIPEFADEYPITVAEAFKIILLIIRKYIAA